MTDRIYNPGEPYMHRIPGGFSAGKIAHLTGSFKPNATGFVLKFQSGPYGDPNDDIGLCLYGRLNERILGMNAFTRQSGWGQEEAFSNQGFIAGIAFELTILCEPSCFKIGVNGQHWGQFSHRLDPSTLTFLNVASASNDIQLSCIWIEDPSRAQSAPQYGTQAPPPYPTSHGSAPYPSAAPQYGYSPYPEAPCASAGSCPYPGAPTGQPNYNQPMGHSSSSKGSKGLLGAIGSAGAAVAGALGASHLIGGKKKGYPSSGGGYPTGPSPGMYPSSQPQYGSYPGNQPQYGGYPPNQYGGHPNGHKSESGGMVNKAMAVGGGIMGAKAMSKGMGGLGGNKALKYGIPLAGAGLGGYMLSKGLGRSFSFDGGCDSFDGGSDSDGGCCDSD